MTDLRKAAEMALEALENADYIIDMADAHYAIEPDDREKLITALRQALAQLDSTSDSATRSADSAESFCKQELHSLMSVAGRMALELECLLLDTKDLSVVSKWWDTGMESLQAYRDYIWSITHGKEEIIALAQGEREPVAWMRNDGTLLFADGNVFAVGQAFYTAPPRKEFGDLLMKLHEKYKHQHNHFHVEAVNFWEKNNGV
jgi:hypothetical protein